MSRVEKRKEESKGKKNLKMVGNILYGILVVITIILLTVVLIQRFSNNKFSLGGFKIFNIVTASMEPDYVVGDVLLSKTKDISEIEIGDDVVYLGEKGEFQDKIVTHRVIDKKSVGGQYIFKTQGIANYEPDPEIRGDQIIGTVVSNIQFLSFISKTINNLYSFYFLVFLPLVVLAFVEVRRIILENKKEKTDKRRKERNIEEKANDEDGKE